MTKSAILFATAFILVQTAAAPALASCEKIALEEAKETGGEVLKVVSAQEDGSEICRITIRIPGKGGKPPRVVTRKVAG